MAEEKMAEKKKKSAWQKYSWILIVVIAAIALWASTVNDPDEENGKAASTGAAPAVVQTV